MFRQTILRQQLSRRAVNFTPRVANYSILDSAKEALKKANQKTGEVLASGIEKTEQVTDKETLKQAGEAVNKKTGEVLASGIEVGEKITNKENIKQAGETVNKKTGEVLADGIEKAEKAVPNPSHLHHKARVNRNSKGYKDLQDKGAKTESEQNRPDDAV